MNRWLLAGAVVGTGALTDAAAQAFPGHTVKRTAAPSTGGSGAVPATARRTRRRAVRHPLTPAAHPPRAHRHPQVTEPVAGATAAPASQAPAASSPAPVQSAPAPVESAPAPAPVQSAPAPVPAPAPAPVVSGGS